MIEIFSFLSLVKILMLKSRDQPTDVSRCAFVLPAVCGDVWFYARLITRVQAAEGGINAEFNVIRRLRVRLLLSEICGRVERKPCACATVGLRRPLRSLSTCALGPQPPPPRTAALFGASRLLRR